MKCRISTYITATTLFAALAIPVGLAAQEQQNKQPSHYTVTDLGTLGGTFSQGSGVNNEGAVAGVSSLPGDVQFHVFILVQFAHEASERRGPHRLVRALAVATKVKEGCLATPIEGSLMACSPRSQISHSL